MVSIFFSHWWGIRMYFFCCFENVIDYKCFVIFQILIKYYKKLNEKKKRPKKKTEKNETDIKKV